MQDERLVGYWSDEDLYQGSMEAADIAFRGDGTGWTCWSRDGGTFHALRFGWHTDTGRNLALDLHQQLSGTVHHHLVPNRPTITWAQADKLKFVSVARYVSETNISRAAPKGLATPRLWDPVPRST